MCPPYLQFHFWYNISITLDSLCKKILSHLKCPIIFDQNAVSHLMIPYLCNFSLTRCPGCKNRCPIPVSISFFMRVPPIDHQVSRIFQFSIDPIFETCVVQTHKDNMCALHRADQRFTNEVQILCGSKTLNYENFTIANMNMNMSWTVKRVRFWEIWWVVLLSCVIFFFRILCLKAPLNCTCIGVKLLHCYLCRLRKKKQNKGVKSHCYTCLEK